MLPRLLILPAAAMLVAADAPALPEVAARGETAPVTDKLGDRADDPAIWQPRRPR